MSSGALDATYTLEDVSQHNTNGDRWIVIDGRVYNVSEFIEKHPGGTKPLEYHSGKDATKSFQSVEKHAGVKTMEDFLKSLCIGRLAPNRE